SGPVSTIVSLTLEYEPEGVVEQVGDKLGIVERQVKSDLERFKKLIEDQGYASGAWRGGVNEGVGIGTPGVSSAAASQGDSGKAGVSGGGVAAGGGRAGGAERNPGERGAARAPRVEGGEVDTPAVVADPPPVATVEVIETVQPVDPD